VLTAFGMVSSTRLGGWRTALVLAPIVVLAIALPLKIYPRFAALDHDMGDFYEVVSRLPMAPKVLTLVYEPESSPWEKYCCYVLVEKGGYQPCLWEPSQGIGAVGFPAGYKKGTRIAAPAISHPKDFSWDKHGGLYDYFLTRREPAGLFTSRKDLELVDERGTWKLWRKRTAPTTI
jgi:hypothetical protein